ncbi:creatininase family protein [Streptomyces sp. 4N509B]|uniref:creatininase family protein n=1 Tax=Streptomyces sp. 4N509B TaxID=3457413 RepID=UPI003FD41CFF
MPLTRFAELSAPAVAALPPDTVALLPVGSLEQHGPHLPVATDHLIAVAVAERAARLATAVDAGAGAGAGACDVTLLPPLTYTKSNEHAWSPGTLWLSATTLLAVLDDLGRSLAASGIRRLALLNAHGGNTALLGVALRELRVHHGLLTFLLPVSLPAPKDSGELGTGIHAGLTETSAMLHLHPELVDMSLARRHVPEHLAAYEHVGFGRPVAFGWTSDDLSPTGVVGDPTGATADLGRVLVADAAARTAAALRECARFRFDTHERPTGRG